MSYNPGRILLCSILLSLAAGLATAQTTDAAKVFHGAIYVESYNQVMVIAVEPRRNSIRMSPAGAGSGAASSDTGMNSRTRIGSLAWPSWPSRANCRQRCTTLALMPCAIATFATDAPAASHSAITWDFTSAL